MHIMILTLPQLDVLLFIGDGMTTNMITAARLIAHKTVNGRYQSTMAMDKFPTVPASKFWAKHSANTAAGRPPNDPLDRFIHH